jgi:hypothetical protein
MSRPGTFQKCLGVGTAKIRPGPDVERNPSGSLKFAGRNRGISVVQCELPTLGVWCKEPQQSSKGLVAPHLLESRLHGDGW